MESKYQLKASELNREFIDAIKLLYGDNQISISITDIVQQTSTNDETNYLLSNTANRDLLLNSINDIQSNKNLITKTIEELKQMTGDA
ncbi:MAG: hypothetical protein SFU91_01950 [Chloroherpetonaceae bacterium]|nr:hypothetical protein [Chloroherpetonaceae bacterium]